MPIIEFGNFSGKRGAKKRKLNHDALAANSERSSVILKLPVEIIEYIFDYLDLEDLRAVSATCKRMQQIATQVYQQIHSGLCPVFYGHKPRRRLCKGYGDVEIHRHEYDNNVDMENFIPFLDKIKIFQGGITKDVLYKFIDRQSEFHQLKQLIIYNSDFTNVKIDRMQEVLNKLEYLQIIYCRFNENFIENLLSLMPNIKRLSVDERNPGATWLAHSYPTLEHCEILSKLILPITTFLALNTNIRKFGTNVLNLWENRNLIRAADLKLEDLSIQFGQLVTPSFWQLLNEYHQLGIYKRLCLHVFCIRFNQGIVDGIASLTGCHRLCMVPLTPFSSVALSHLSHLQDISFPATRYIIDIDTVATRLENLKLIHFGISSLSHAKLFICRNPKLERLQIDWFMDEAGNIEEDKCLNLIKLNNERAKLPKAKKTTIFVEESVYLATKRANRETDLTFVKLKRTNTSNEREFDFRYPRIYKREPNYRP